jgi:hypothetical protein
MDTSIHDIQQLGVRDTDQLMDMFVVILGILGAGLVTWMYISQRSTFMILACLAIMAYAVFMLFIANNMLAQLNLSPDAFQYKMVRWTRRVHARFRLWPSSRLSGGTAEEVDRDGQAVRRTAVAAAVDDRRRDDWNSGKNGKNRKKGRKGRSIEMIVRV